MRVFISYSWDSQQHKSRVANFVKKLRDNGLGAEFDGDIILGERIPHYMETRVAESDCVLFICTPNYKEKADKREGGVGYESNIITGELYSSQNETKFVPLLFSGTWATSLPSWASGKSGLDFTSGEKSESEFERLLAHLDANFAPDKKDKPHNASTIYVKKTFQQRNNEQICVKKPNKPRQEDEPIRIVRVITEEVGFPKNDGTRGSALYAVPFELSSNPSNLWVELFLQNWKSPSRFTTMHRPGIAKVYGKKIILDGTTIDEVERYHKETLLLAVKKANKTEQDHLRKIAAEEKRKDEEKETHLKNVRDSASRISFDE